jgi:hypothetical protein
MDHVGFRRHRVILAQKVLGLLEAHIETQQPEDGFQRTRRRSAYSL